MTISQAALRILNGPRNVRFIACVFVRRLAHRILAPFDGLIEVRLLDSGSGWSTRRELIGCVAGHRPHGCSPLLFNKPDRAQLPSQKLINVSPIVYLLKRLGSKGEAVPRSAS